MKHFSIIWATHIPFVGRDRAVGIVNMLRAGRSGDPIPVGARFTSPVQTGSGTHPSSCKMGTRSFPGVKRPRPGVDLYLHFTVPVPLSSLYCTCIFIFTLLYMYLYLHFTVPVSLRSLYCTCIFTFTLMYLYLYLHFTVPVSLPSLYCTCIFTFTLLYLYLYLQFTVPVSLPSPFIPIPFTRNIYDCYGNAFVSYSYFLCHSLLSVLH
jgi:hypothetical protein